VESLAISTNSTQGQILQPSESDSICQLSFLVWSSPDDLVCGELKEEGQRCRNSNQLITYQTSTIQPPLHHFSYIYIDLAPQKLTFYLYSHQSSQIHGMAISTESTISASASTEREILPKHLKPLHYDLIIEPHLEEAKEFDGTVVIDLVVVEQTSSITLNAIDLEISETEVVNEDGKTIDVSGLEFDKVKERVTINLKQKVTVGQKIKLRQTFKGSLLHNASAFFRSPVVVDGNTKWMVSTQLEATDARRVFPAFDEPALKATFTVTLIAEKHLTCLSNMDVASEKEVGAGKKSVTFNRTPQMSTYILAFAIGDMKMIETDSFRVPVRV
jgi:hypothetical protein